MFFTTKNKINLSLFFFIFVFCIIYYPDFFLKGHYLKDQLFIESVIFFKYQMFTINFIQLFTSPIYFSEFGSLINGILKYLFLNDYFYQFKIPLILYILSLTLILLFNLKNKFYLLFLTFFLFLFIQ